MKLENAKRLRSALEDMGVECDLREDYSGRCMYGETTAGIVVPRVADLLAAVAVVAADLSHACHEDNGAAMKEFVKDLKNAKTDDMGREMIVY